MHMYVVAYGGQESTSSVTFQELSTLVFETVSRWDLELSSQAKLTGQQASGIPLSASLASGLRVCTTPGFLCECWGLNSGPCIRTASILQTALSFLLAGTTVKCLLLSV